MNNSENPLKNEIKSNTFIDMIQCAINREAQLTEVHKYNPYQSSAVKSHYRPCPSRPNNKYLTPERSGATFQSINLRIV